jgi:DNA mismatch repair ATPase MutS
VARDHIRPSFIRRWDGESNELEIFAEELMDLTPMLQVYWRVKCKNMNTIVLIEMGREYMTLENDAIRLHEIFKKKLIKFSKFLMIYFWGKETEIAKKQLFDMKIPVLIMNEFEDPEYREKYGMVRREVAEVLTPALHLSYEDQVPRSRLLLAIYHRDSKFAALVLDS